MKTTTKILFILTATFCFGIAARAADKPNILFIVGDDMGYGDVGFHKCPDIPTPNLDALAAAGVRFTSGYVSGPYCSPSRAGLMTGRYQTRFGHEFNPMHEQGLPLTETTIADRLKAAGYVTGLVGKWHLGAMPAQHPQKRGFDEFFGFLGGDRHYFGAGGIMRGTEPIEKLDYTTDAFGREAVAFIERHKEHPWFLYLAFNAVHTPMDATDDRLAKFPKIAVSQRVLSWWEREPVALKTDQLVALADALNVSADFLLGRETKPLKAKGPKGRMLQLFEVASSLSRSQQEKVAAVLEPFVLQHASGSGLTAH